ncbi:hypothetical protein ACJJIC_15580 [Microbulbifer sp. ANSA002]|uniref:hypothetical protein n=1 Tax=unclassified Microbulbifer TaxID=2619833 RepID=UPI0040413B06
MRLLLPILPSTALAGCLEVEAKGERNYDRHEWLPKWSDSDGDCQSTRHELLVQNSATPNLAAIIAINEHEARDGGYRDENNMVFALNLLGGKVFEHDATYRRMDDLNDAVLDVSYMIESAV